MIDRARLTIIASVPFAMAFQLLLLNYFFNPLTAVDTNVKKIVKAETKKNVNKEVVSYQNENKKSSAFLSDYDLIDSITFKSAPAPHTLALDDEGDKMLEEEDLRNQGVILK